MATLEERLYCLKLIENRLCEAKTLAEGDRKSETGKEDEEFKLTSVLPLLVEDGGQTLLF